MFRVPDLALVEGEVPRSAAGRHGPLADKRVRHRIELSYAAVVGSCEPHLAGAINGDEDRLVACDIREGEELRRLGSRWDLAKLAGWCTTGAGRREVAARLREPEVARSVHRGAPRVADSTGERVRRD